MKNLLKSSKTTWALLILFLFHQFKYILNYHIISHRFASGKILNKIIAIFSGDLNNPSLSEFSTGESFGFIVMLPSYIFGHSVRILNKQLNIDVIDNFFNTDDAIVYFFMNLSLSLYTAIGLTFVYIILKKMYGVLYSNLFLIFLLLTPSFIGHSLFNFKDIPFAISLLICNLLLLSKFNFLEPSISLERLFNSDLYSLYQL